MTATEIESPPFSVLIECKISAKFATERPIEVRLGMHRVSDRTIQFMYANITTQKDPLDKQGLLWDLDKTSVGTDCASKTCSIKVRKSVTFQYLVKNPVGKHCGVYSCELHDFDLLLESTGTYQIKVEQKVCMYSTLNII